MRFHMYALNLHKGWAIVGPARLIDFLIKSWLEEGVNIVAFKSFEVLTSVVRKIQFTKQGPIPRGLLWIVGDDRVLRSEHHDVVQSDVRLAMRGADYRKRSLGIEVLGLADGNTASQRPGSHVITHVTPAYQAQRVYKRRRLWKPVALSVRTTSMHRTLSRLTSPRHVAVAPEMVSPVFHESAGWHPVGLADQLAGEIRLFSPAYADTRKYQRSIPVVTREVRQLSGKSLLVLTMLSPAKLAPFLPVVPGCIINIGDVINAQGSMAHTASNRLCFPSEYEPFPISTLEALFLNRPVVSTRNDLNTGGCSTHCVSTTRRETLKIHLNRRFARCLQAATRERRLPAIAMSQSEPSHVVHRPLPASTIFGLYQGMPVTMCNQDVLASPPYQPKVRAT